jgi:hypothetical protein
MALVHPIFSVLVSRPELVMDHVAGYAALVQEEASSVGAEVTKRGIAWAVCGVGALLFLILGGVASCWARCPTVSTGLLVLVPAIPLVVAGLAFNAARKPMPAKAFAELRAQLDADAQALRTLGGRP